MTSKQLASAVLPLLLIAGCARLGEWTPPEEAASLAVESGEPLAFRAEASPVDEPGLPPGLLTLSEAARLALRSDPGIQAAFARVRIAQAEAGQARLLPNPVVSVAVRLPERGASVIEAGIAQDFLSILQKPGLTDAANNRLRAAGAEAISAVLDLVAEVQSRYAAVQALDALRREFEERKSIIRRLEEQARARLAAGEGTGLDVATVETQRLELEVESAQSELERREGRLSLARLIGRPSAAADWTLSAWEPPNAASGDEGAWVEAAMEARPEIQAKRWELAALGAEQRLAWTSVLEGSEAGADGEREEGEWSVGPAASLPIPILDFGQARRARARAAVSAAKHELTEARRRVVEEIRSAHAAYLTTQTMLLRVRRELVPLAERRLEQAEGLYRQGETSLTEVLLAEQDMHAAHARAIELERKCTEALIRLERAVGGAGVASRLEAPGAGRAREGSAHGTGEGHPAGERQGRPAEGH